MTQIHQTVLDLLSCTRFVFVFACDPVFAFVFYFGRSQTFLATDIEELRAAAADTLDSNDTPGSSTCRSRAPGDLRASRSVGMCFVFSHLGRILPMVLPLAAP